jgi:hypothetical protein
MDYLVIGAGRAGVQLGSLLRRAGRDYLILEAGQRPASGGVQRTLPRRPRHGQAPAQWLNISYDTRAACITRDASQHFVVVDQHGRVYRARRLIVATGLSRPYIPPVVQLGFDRTIIYAGRRPDRLDSTIFGESCRPELTAGGRLPALTSEWESVNVPDLYFAGTLTRVRDGKAGDGELRDVRPAAGAVRYHVRALQRMLDCKYEGAEWPHRELPADPAAMTDAVLTRINRSPGLVRQYAVLCDLIVAEPGVSTVRYYEELPVDYVHDSMFGSADCYFMVTLEYGDGRDFVDPFDVEAGEGGWAAADRGRGDRYLRPVIRRYRRWSLISVQRLPEDICNDWSDEKEFHQPLRAYFGRQMAFAAV